MTALARRRLGLGPIATAMLDAAEPRKPTISRTPVQLQPIPWGKPDKALARALGQHVRDSTPAIVIPFNPRTHARVRRVLRSLGIYR